MDDLVQQHRKIEHSETGHERERQPEIPLLKMDNRDSGPNQRGTLRNAISACSIGRFACSTRSSSVGNSAARSRFNCCACSL
jgi:hypothetical protein